MAETFKTEICNVRGPMFNRLPHMLQKLPHSEIPELYFPEADFGTVAISQACDGF
jgi:hypothetical protein